MKIIYTIVTCALFMSCAAQKKASTDAYVYAYSQPVIPGIPPQKSITEDNRNPSMENIQPRPNYMIYLQGVPANAQITQLWLNEKAYSVRTELVHAPVIVSNTTVPNTKPDTLVKATTQPVLKVIPDSENAAATPSSAMRSLLKNQVVIECVINGKTQYYTAKAIKNLAPLALQ